MTALTTFKEWTRDEVAPLLKERGFARAGLLFRARIGSNVGLIHLQKSGRSSASEVYFTATAGVWCRRIADFDGSSSDGKPGIEDCHWTKRLGEMVSSGDDYWWVLQAKHSDREGLNKFTQDLVLHAVPSVQAMASDDALRDLWLTGNGPGLTSLQRLINLSILLREIGPVQALPAIIDQLNERSIGKPVHASLQAHLKRLTTFARKADAAN